MASTDVENIYLLLDQSTKETALERDGDVTDALGERMVIREMEARKRLKENRVRLNPEPKGNAATKHSVERDDAHV